MFYPDDMCTCDDIGGPVIRRCPVHDLEQRLPRYTLTPEAQRRLDDMVRRLRSNPQNHDPGDEDPDR